MKNSKLLFHSLINSLGVFIYTSAVAWLMYSGQRFFGQAHNFWMPLAMLLLFVLSATIVGLLVLGRPVYMYLNNDKPDSIKLLFYTLGWLAIITAIILAAQVL